MCPARSIVVPISGAQKTSAVRSDSSIILVAMFDHDAHQYSRFAENTRPAGKKPLSAFVTGGLLEAQGAMPKRKANMTAKLAQLQKRIQ